MSQGTAIEWTHRTGTIPATMNALVGCQKVSAGCAHCYAIEVAHLRAGNPLPVIQKKFAGTTRVEGGKRVWTGKVTLSEKALLAPLRWKKPRTIFVNALSDLFYEGVPDEWIDRHFAVFALCPQHTFIVLTKRPERMRAYLTAHGLRQRIYAHATLTAKGDFSRFPLHMAHHRSSGEDWWPLPNVWLGVSFEDQETADKRVAVLRETPAAVRLVSGEPLLGSVDMAQWFIDPDLQCSGFIASKTMEEGYCAMCAGHRSDPVHHSRAGAIDWVIVGGESGPGARPMHPDWARSLRDQCKAAGVPFFFKQWGEFLPDNQNPAMSQIPPPPASGAIRVGKKAAGHLLDGVEHHAFPAVQP